MNASSVKRIGSFDQDMHFQMNFVNWLMLDQVSQVIQISKGALNVNDLEFKLFAEQTCIMQLS